MTILSNSVLFLTCKLILTEFKTKFKRNLFQAFLSLFESFWAFFQAFLSLSPSLLRAFSKHSPNLFQTCFKRHYKVHLPENCVLDVCIQYFSFCKSVKSYLILIHPVERAQTTLVKYASCICLFPPRRLGKKCKLRKARLLMLQSCKNRADFSCLQRTTL